MNERHFTLELVYAVPESYVVMRDWKGTKIGTMKASHANLRIFGGKTKIKVKADFDKEGRFSIKKVMK